MKDFFRQIHLYLGLVAGIVISITCFTGAALVFEKELQATLYSERYYVTPGVKRESLGLLLSNLRQSVPDAKVTGIKSFSDPSRSVEISFMAETHPAIKEGEKKGPGGNPNIVAYMNPYNGQVIAVGASRNAFFTTMFGLHRWLLAGDVGKLIVGISTSIFLFILITGIILWWPGKIKKLKQRLKVKISSGWKRMNHDLHITVGFYTCIFLFVFAFTGLAWSFEWFNDSIYWVTRSEHKRYEPPSSLFVAGKTPVDPEVILSAAASTVGAYQHISLNLPKDSVSAYSASVLSDDPAHEKANDQYFFDQYSGNLIATNLYSDRNLGQRVRSTFYPFHVGSIGGMAGRVIALLSCIAGFTFPVTGTILWINRLRKKDKKKARKKANHRKEALKAG